jgi:hypothetical protein
MTKSVDRRGHALFVAGVGVLVLMVGLFGCGAADPVRDRPGNMTGGVGASGGAGFTGIASAPGAAGMQGTAASGPGTAGTSSGGVAGTGGPLPPFNGGDAALNMVQAGAVCARLATLDCAGEAHCCNNPGRTVAECEADIMLTCTQKFYIDALSLNPITGFDKSAAQSAFTVLEQKASQCDVSVAAFGTSLDGLPGIFKGTIAPGKSCKPTQSIPDNATAGAALASCTGIATTACLPQGLVGDWICSPKSAAGGPCLTDVNCNAGMYCNLPSATSLGTCAATLPVGSACTLPSQCSSLFCKNNVCLAPDQQAAYCLKTP